MATLAVSRHVSVQHTTPVAPVGGLISAAHRSWGPHITERDPILPAVSLRGDVTTSLGHVSPRYTLGHVSPRYSLGHLSPRYSLGHVSPRYMREREARRSRQQFESESESVDLRLHTAATIRSESARVVAFGDDAAATKSLDQRGRSLERRRRSLERRVGGDHSLSRDSAFVDENNNNDESSQDYFRDDCTGYDTAGGELASPRHRRSATECSWANSIRETECTTEEAQDAHSCHRWASCERECLSNCQHRSTDVMAPVLLRVYDFSHGLASKWSKLLLGEEVGGVWHSGVHVYGYLYHYFGGAVFKSRPEKFDEFEEIRPVMIHHLGYTSVSKPQFINHLATIIPEFNDTRYDILEWNCNHFSQQICRFLVSRNIPAYITDLPSQVTRSAFGRFIVKLVRKIDGHQADWLSSCSSSSSSSGNTDGCDAGCSNTVADNPVQTPRWVAHHRNLPTVPPKDARRFDSILPATTEYHRHESGAVVDQASGCALCPAATDLSPRATTPRVTAAGGMCTTGNCGNTGFIPLCPWSFLWEGQHEEEPNDVSGEGGDRGLNSSDVVALNSSDVVAIPSLALALQRREALLHHCMQQIDDDFATDASSTKRYDEVMPYVTDGRRTEGINEAGDDPTATRPSYSMRVTSKTSFHPRLSDGSGMFDSLSTPPYTVRSNTDAQPSEFNSIKNCTSRNQEPHPSFTTLPSAVR